MALVELLAVDIVAVIVAVPAATPVTSPLEDTVATEVALETHVASVVTSVVLPSANTTLAAICWVLVAAIVGEAGLTVNSVGELVLTMTVNDFETDPDVAVIVVVPEATAVTNPEVLTVAIEVFPLFHVAVLVTSVDVPPTVTEVADTWLVSACLRMRALEERLMWSTLLSETKNPLQPLASTNDATHRAITTKVEGLRI